MHWRKYLSGYALKKDLVQFYLVQDGDEMDMQRYLSKMHRNKDSIKILIEFVLITRCVFELNEKISNHY